MIDDECGAVGVTRIGRGTEVLGENLPQYHFVHHKSHTGRGGRKPASNRLSYGKAWGMRPRENTIARSGFLKWCLWLSVYD
jgi:hypothetical protein